MDKKTPQPLSRSFAYAFSGIAQGLAQRNMRIHLVFAVIAIVACALLRCTVAEWAIVLVLMLIPIKVAYSDGGTGGYRALLWQVEKLHRFTEVDNGQIGYLVGTRVTLLCGLIPVYDDTHVVTEP